MIEVAIASKKQHRSRFAAFVRDDEGATAVEFAIVAAPFLALTIAIIQTFLVFFAQEHLESVVQQSSRLILTGQTQSAQKTQSQFHQDVCNQVVILFNCSGLMVDVQVATSWSATNTTAPNLTYDASGNVTNVWQFNPGNASDIVVVRVMYLWPVFLGPLGFNLSNQTNGSRMIMATAAFQNEPSS
ncbi:TadE/TadG family type IV pilus assembly protein [Bradyrhizobium sp. Tv2a-2]|uniref:TadE/TadG family type IV pilus assembly protein n=1 Tax=Bradyrhizobium sp. Tv2a-2 TaxID=113395 RepID=UPI000416C642|nr:TadE/TadG family type IV pilus assembly protein [Bradyrhizobium sp. Tv2a-2]